MKIEIDSNTETVTIDGNKLSFQVLASFRPQPDVWHRFFERADDTGVLIVQTERRGPIVRLTRRICSEIPIGEPLYLDVGIYPTISNPHGALSIRTPSGKDLGIKPDEFEIVEKGWA